MENRKHIVFSLLKRYGHLTSAQIVDLAEVVFGIYLNEHTAKRYRSYWEAEHVGEVYNVDATENTPARRIYTLNGYDPVSGKIYWTPFKYWLRLVLRDKQAKRLIAIYRMA